MDLSFKEVTDIINYVRKVGKVTCVREDGELMVYINPDDTPEGADPYLIASQYSVIDSVEFTFISEKEIKLSPELLVMLEEFDVKVSTVKVEK